MSQYTNERYVTGDEYAYDVRVVKPEPGVRAYFIGRNGRGDVCTYNPDWHVAWKPLPKMRPHTKEWIQRLWEKDPMGKVKEMFNV